MHGSTSAIGDARERQDSPQKPQKIRGIANNLRSKTESRRKDAEKRSYQKLLALETIDVMSSDSAESIPSVEANSASPRSESSSTSGERRADASQELSQESPEHVFHDVKPERLQGGVPFRTENDVNTQKGHHTIEKLYVVTKDGDYAKRIVERHPKWHQQVLVVMKKYLGAMGIEFVDFREGQLEALFAISVLKLNVMAVQPTGSYKSSLMHLPAILDAECGAGGLTILVLPLTALIEEQLRFLEAVGRALGRPRLAIRLAKSDKSEPSSECHESLQWLLRSIENEVQGRREAKEEVNVVLVTPDKLIKGDGVLKTIKKAMQKGLVRRFFWDECHCTLHDWRGGYTDLLKQMRTLDFERLQQLMATATITSKGVLHVLKSLKVTSAMLFLGQVNRPNIHYSVVPKVVSKSDDLAAEQLCDLLEKMARDLAEDASEATGISGGREAQRLPCGIVFVMTKKQSGELADVVNARWPGSAASFNAEMDVQSREDNARRWRDGEIRVMVATSAFGMGINKPDCRFVLHYCIPCSVEEFHQQSGRCGRDGRRSLSVVLWRAKDVSDWLHDVLDSTAQKGELLQCSRLFEDSAQCFRQRLLAYFGEAYEALVHERDGALWLRRDGCCGACDQGTVAVAQDRTAMARLAVAFVHAFQETDGTKHLQHTSNFFFDSKAKFKSPSFQGEGGTVKARSLPGSGSGKHLGPVDSCQQFFRDLEHLQVLKETFKTEKQGHYKPVFKGTVELEGCEGDGKLWLELLRGQRRLLSVVDIRTALIDARDQPLRCHNCWTVVSRGSSQAHPHSDIPCVLCRHCAFHYNLHDMKTDRLENGEYQACTACGMCDFKEGRTISQCENWTRCEEEGCLCEGREGQCHHFMCNTCLRKCYWLPEAFFNDKKRMQDLVFHCYKCAPWMVPYHSKLERFSALAEPEEVHISPGDFALLEIVVGKQQSQRLHRVVRVEAVDNSRSKAFVRLFALRDDDLESVDLASPPCAGQLEYAIGQPSDTISTVQTFRRYVLTGCGDDLGLELLRDGEEDTPAVAEEHLLILDKCFVRHATEEVFPPSSRALRHRFVYHGPRLEEVKVGVNQVHADTLVVRRYSPLALEPPNTKYREVVAKQRAISRGTAADKFAQLNVQQQELQLALDTRLRLEPGAYPDWSTAALEFIKKLSADKLWGREHFNRQLACKPPVVDPLPPSPSLPLSSPSRSTQEPVRSPSPSFGASPLLTKKATPPSKQRLVASRAARWTEESNTALKAAVAGCSSKEKRIAWTKVAQMMPRELFPPGASGKERGQACACHWSRLCSRKTTLARQKAASAEDVAGARPQVESGETPGEDVDEVEDVAERSYDPRRMEGELWPHLYRRGGKVQIVWQYTTGKDETPAKLAEFFGLNRRALVAANKKEYATLTPDSKLKRLSTLFLPDVPASGQCSRGYMQSHDPGLWVFGVDLRVRLYQGELGCEALVPRCCGSACLRTSKAACRKKFDIFLHPFYRDLTMCGSDHKGCWERYFATKVKPKERPCGVCEVCGEDRPGADEREQVTYECQRCARHICQRCLVDVLLLHRDDLPGLNAFTCFSCSARPPAWRSGHGLPSVADERPEPVVLSSSSSSSPRSSPTLALGSKACSLHTPSPSPPRLSTWGPAAEPPTAPDEALGDLCNPVGGPSASPPPRTEERALEISSAPAARKRQRSLSASPAAASQPPPPSPREARETSAASSSRSSSVTRTLSGQRPAARAPKRGGGSGRSAAKQSRAAQGAEVLSGAEDEELSVEEEGQERWDRDNPKRGPGSSLAEMAPLSTGLTELPKQLKEVVDFTRAWLAGENGTAARLHVEFEMERFATQYDPAKVNIEEVKKEAGASARQRGEMSRDAMMVAADKVIAAVNKMLKDRVAAKKVGEKRGLADAESAMDEAELGDDDDLSDQNDYEEYMSEERHHDLGRTDVVRKHRQYEYSARLQFKTGKLVLDVPQRADSCRSFREHGSYTFLKVRVPRNRRRTDEESEQRQQLIKRLIESGVVLGGGGRRLMVVPSGETNIKNRTLMLACSEPDDLAHGTAMAIMAEHCSQLPDERLSVAKFCARFGLLFSRTLPTISVRTDEVRMEEDITWTWQTDGKEVEWCATDGCSAIAVSEMEEVRKLLGLDYMPSWVQFRYNVCKGVLYVDRAFHKQAVNKGKRFAIRPSQQKLPFGPAPSEHQQVLEVNSCAPNPRTILRKPARLNQQIIAILREMGAPDSVFLEMQKKALAAAKPLDNRDEALEFLGKKASFHEEANVCVEMLQDEVYDVNELYVRKVTKRMWENVLEKSKKKMAIECEESRHLVGIADPTGTLKHDEVFVRLGGPMDLRDAAEQDGPSKGVSYEWRELKGMKVAVGRNPCQHPGDVRIFSAVSNPELEQRLAFNHIVFSTKPDPKTGQSVADKMSGGDYDGDLYLVIWDRNIVEPIVKKKRYLDLHPHLYSAMEKTQPKEVAGCAVSWDMEERYQQVKDYLFFMMTEFEDNLGFITNIHKAMVDEADPENLARGVVQCNAPDQSRTVTHMSEREMTRMKRQQQTSDVVKRLKEHQARDPQGKGLRSDRVKELAILCAEAVDTFKVGKTVQIPAWAKHGVQSPHWMKEIGQGPCGNGHFESHSLYAKLFQQVVDCQKRLDRSCSMKDFAIDHAHKKYRDDTAEPHLCMKELCPSDEIKKLAKSLKSRIMSRIRWVYTKNKGRLFQPNIREEIREAFVTFGQNMWATETKGKTRRQVQELAWQLYYECYHDAKTKEETDKMSLLVDIPWRIQGCRQMLRELKAVCVATERHPDKYITHTGLVLRTDAQQ